MPKPIIYFLDDTPSQRQGLEWDLRELFGVAYDVLGLPVAPHMQDYHQHLDSPDVLGVLIDQRLNETGEITGFTGLDLAKHLRGVFPEMPIYIVTGYDPDEQIKGADSGSADAVVYKSELRAGTPDSERFKQRFLRQTGRYQEALTKAQQKFRELLSKSIAGTITNEEKAELLKLDTERLLPTQAGEEITASTLQKDIAALEGLLAKLPTKINPQQ